MAFDWSSNGKMVLSLLAGERVGVREIGTHTKLVIA
jgi:hypothetical protein